MVVHPEEKVSPFVPSKPAPKSAEHTGAAEPKKTVNKSYSVTMEKEQPEKCDLNIKKENASAKVEAVEAVVVEDVTKAEEEKTFKSRELQSDRARQEATHDTNISADTSSLVIMELEDNIEQDNEVIKEVVSTGLEVNKSPIIVESTSKDDSVVCKNIAETLHKGTASKQSCHDTNFAAQEDARLVMEAEKTVDKVTKPTEEKVVRKVSYDTNLVADQQMVNAMEGDSPVSPALEVNREKASKNIEATKGVMTVETTTDQDSTTDRKVDAKRRKKNAQISSTICSKKCADNEEVNVMETLPKTRETDKKKKAQAKVQVESSNEALQVQCDTKLLNENRIPAQKKKVEAERVKKVSIVEPKSSIEQSEVSVIESSEAAPVPEQQVAGASESLVPTEVLSLEEARQEEKTNTKQTESVQTDRTKTKSARKKQVTSSEVTAIKDKDHNKESGKPSIQTESVPEEEGLTSCVKVQSQTAVNIPDFEFELEADEGVAVTNIQFQDMVKSAATAMGEHFGRGLSVTEVVNSLNSEQRNILKRPETQVALLSVAKRIGNAPIIQNIVVQELAESKETTESFGSKALFAALQTNQAGSQHVASYFQPKDFDTTKSKAVLCQILNEAHEIESRQAQQQAEDRKTDTETFLNAIKCLVEETKDGKTVSEIITQRTPREMEEMQCIESQMAIVGALEKLGHAEVTENIITEQMSVDRIGLLNVIGTKALSSVLHEKDYTTEQIMVLFQPQDFEKKKVKEKVAKILNIAQEINQAQVEEEN